MSPSFSAAARHALSARNAPSADAPQVVTVTTVEAPFALDADGAEVPTYYEVEDDTLVQVVDHNTGGNMYYRYPIVADPKITHTWWNSTVYFNRHETGALIAGAGAIGATAALIPEPTLSKAVAVAAGLAAAYIAVIYSYDKCVKFVYYGHVANVWQPYWGKEAKGYCK